MHADQDGPINIQATRDLGTGTLEFRGILTGTVTLSSLAD